MAVKTLNLFDTVPSGLSAGYLMDEATAPSENYFHGAHSLSGWRIGTEATPRFGHIEYNVERSPATLTNSEGGQTIVPDATVGNFFRSPKFSGSFAAGNWTFQIAVRAGSSRYDGRFKFRYRLYRSANGDGTVATLLTTSVQISNTTTSNLSTGASQNMLATFTAPAITLSDEHLFLVPVIETTQSGALNTDDVNLRKGSASRIITPDFTPAATGRVSMGTLAA